MEINKIILKVKENKLIIFLIGILLMILVIPTEKAEEKEAQNTSAEISGTGNYDGYARSLENQLEHLLEKMEGAGDVHVMVTLKSSAEQIIEKDMEVQDEVVTEQDSQGGVRTTNQSARSETTIYNEESGGKPFIIKEITPKVEGVVVIAEGGNNAVVVKNITEAIQALFGIESHKIRIVKKGG